MICLICSDLLVKPLPCVKFGGVCPYDDLLLYKYLLVVSNTNFKNFLD